MLQTEFEKEKKTSKLKIFLFSILGYASFNMVRSILFVVICLVINFFKNTFIYNRLEEIAIFFTAYIGYTICKVIGIKLLKTKEAIEKYFRTIGVLFIINNAYFLIDYFRYHEGDIFYIIISLLLGIGLIIAYQSKNQEQKKDNWQQERT